MVADSSGISETELVTVSDRGRWDMKKSETMVATRLSNTSFQQGGDLIVGGGGNRRR